MTTNAPAQDVTRTLTAYSTLAIAQALAVVPDPAADRAVRLPVTASTVTAFAGITPRPIAAASQGEVIRIFGDSTVLTASGTVAVGDSIFVDTTATKEGRGKKFVSIAANGSQLLIGYALTAATDGETFEIVLQVGLAT